MLVKFCSLVTPKATLTWKSHDFPNKQIAELFDKGVLIEDKDGKTLWKFK